MIEFLIGFVTGIVACYFIIKMMLRSLIKRLEEALSEETNPESASSNKISARVEEHNGVFYVYNIDNNAFLGQGSTFSEIKRTLEERFPSSNVFISEGDKGVIEKIKLSEQSTATGG